MEGALKQPIHPHSFDTFLANSNISCWYDTCNHMGKCSFKMGTREYLSQSNHMGFVRNSVGCSKMKNKQKIKERKKEVN